MGSVLEIRKHAGDFVKQGEVLIVLDDREVAGNIGQAEGGLAQAQAAASLAEANYKRYQLLFERGSASQLELDQARFAHESAQGAVKPVKAAIERAGSYRRLCSFPLPSMAAWWIAWPRWAISPRRDATLMSVEDARRLPPPRVALGKRNGRGDQGDSVQVEVPSLAGRAWTGIVAEVVPAVDPATRTLLVKIDLPEDPALRSGMFARARFVAGDREALRVPRGALVKRGGMDGVFVVNDGVASFRLLQLAADGSGDAVEVLSGLRAGDRVVLDPPSTLTEGAAVEVQS